VSLPQPVPGLVISYILPPRFYAHIRERIVEMNRQRRLARVPRTE